MTHIVKLIGALAVLLLAGTAAVAHARLARASPPVGSSSQKAPREVVLWFTEKLEPAFSSIEVRNASGAVVSNGKAQLGADRVQLRVPLQTLSPGTYKVIWRVLSVDTHRAQGDFTFRVGL